MPGPTRGPIVHVCEALGGGVLEVLRALTADTVSRGYETILVHGRRPETPPDLRAVFDPGLRLVEIPGWGRRNLPGALGTTLRAALEVRRLTAGRRGGVLHLHSTYAGALRALVRAPGWQVFYSPHAYAFANASLPWPVRTISATSETLLGARGITLAVSRAEGAQAARLVGASRVAVVQNGIALPADAGPGPGARFVVMSLGRAAYQRRPDQFAQIASTLRAELDADFVWIGNGPRADALAAAGVSVSGWLPRRRAEAELARAHVVLHLAAFEGLPLALLEAMGAGKAVVATDLPPIREALGSAGLLVSSTEEAVAALRRIHADEGLREALGKRARERVRRLFSREAMTARTLAAYGLG